jgi:hypothetical protein
VLRREIRGAAQINTARSDLPEIPSTIPALAILHIDEWQL